MATSENAIGTHGELVAKGLTSMGLNANQCPTRSQIENSMEGEVTGNYSDFQQPRYRSVNVAIKTFTLTGIVVSEPQSYGLRRGIFADVLFSNRLTTMRIGEGANDYNGALWKSVLTRNVSPINRITVAVGTVPMTLSVILEINGVIVFENSRHYAALAIVNHDFAPVTPLAGSVNNSCVLKQHF